MTWLKIGDDFADDCADARLSDAAFRTHVEALSRVMRRLTDGHLTEVDLRRCAGTPHWEMAVAELVKAGFWKQTATGYRIMRHMEDQPTSKEVRKRQENNAKRQKQWRERNALRAPLRDE